MIRVLHPQMAWHHPLRMNCAVGAAPDFHQNKYAPVATSIVHFPSHQWVLPCCPHWTPSLWWWFLDGRVPSISHELCFRHRCTCPSKTGTARHTGAAGRPTSPSARNYVTAEGPWPAAQL